jgi:hypothetical protein
VPRQCWSLILHKMPGREELSFLPPGFFGNCAPSTSLTFRRAAGTRYIERGATEAKMAVKVGGEAFWAGNAATVALMPADAR